MRIKKYFLPLFFIAFIVFLLHACNLSVIKPDANLPLAPASEIPIIPTNTPTSIPTSIQTSTPSLTLAPSATFTPSLTPLPSPTAPTFTPTQQWSACPGIVVTVNDTNDGDMLHVLRCEDRLEYDLGPLSKGIYAVGPNNKFLVYVSISGYIYGARIGDTYMTTLFDLINEHEFTVFNKKIVPDFKISFVEKAPNYKLILLEKNYDQKRVYDLQPRITH